MGLCSALLEEDVQEVQLRGRGRFAFALSFLRRVNIAYPETRCVCLNS